MSIEGSLQIKLTVRNNAVDEVAISSSRPVHAAKIFKGKSVDETLELIPMLFSICGTAQACAAVSAIEKATGRGSSDQTQRLRHALVRMETLREHLWRILLEWPQFVGEQSDQQCLVEVSSIQQNYRQAICPEGDVFQLKEHNIVVDTTLLESVIQRLLVLLQDKLFCMPPQQWLAISGQASFSAWLESCPSDAAKLISWVMEQGWAGVGACEVESLPTLDQQGLNTALQEPEFVERPQWNEHCCETSCQTRNDSSLLTALQQQYGNGLLVRLVARLTEIARMSGRLQPDDEMISEASPPLAADDTGIGQVAAARGQLVHRVAIDEDEVTNYQILAPTEWNFHPWGVVSRSLSTLQGDSQTMEKQAHMLINAIDPCVGYELQIVQG